MEDRRRRRVAFEDAAKNMLRYLEDSEDLEVSISELKGQLQSAQQARNEKGYKIFETFRQGEDEVYCTLPAWRDGTRN